MSRFVSLAALAVALVFSSNLLAAEPKIDTVLDGLNNPCGIAVQPETGHIFVADSGALKVVRVVNGKAEDVITGFTKDVYGKGPMYDIGPLGLAFLDKDTLVVGGGGKPDGEESLFVFTIPAAGQKAISADNPKFSFKLEATADLKAEGNFYGIATTKTAIFVTSNGDDTKGWVAKADINGTKVEKYTRFIPTKEAVEVDAPVGIAISPAGHVVIGQMGEINVPEDGLITFYNAKTGEKLMNVKAGGLYDITALAYSPKGQLYALDFAWMDTTKGGLFQIIAENSQGQQGAKATKVASLDKPTAMAFGPDGSLYITVIGTQKEGDAKPAGKLLKIAPSL
jgi:DNA-binding beta-propeller fold protein YncE